MAKINYDWALNPVKLEQAIEALTKKKAVDSKVEINEESIKEEYIARAGLMRPEKEAKASVEEAGDIDAPRGRGRGRRASSDN